MKGRRDEREEGWSSKVIERVCRRLLRLVDCEGGDEYCKYLHIGAHIYIWNEMPRRGGSDTVLVSPPSSRH